LLLTGEIGRWQESKDEREEAHILLRKGGCDRRRISDAFRPFLEKSAVFARFVVKISR